MRSSQRLVLLGAVAFVAACSSSETNSSVGPGLQADGGAGSDGSSGSGGQGGAGGSSGASGTAGSAGTAAGGAGGGSAGAGGIAGNGGMAGAAGNGGAGAGGTQHNPQCTNPLNQLGTPECKACANTAENGGACTADKAACTDDTECAASLKCFGTCTNQACLKKCIVDHDAGSTKLFRYFGCLDAICHDNCYCVTCNQFTNSKCGLCWATDCNESCSNLAYDAEGIAITLCLQNLCKAGDDTCTEACLNRFPAAKPLYEALQQCTKTTCQDECGG